MRGGEKKNKQKTPRQIQLNQGKTMRFFPRGPGAASGSLNQLLPSPRCQGKMSHHLQHTEIERIKDTFEMSYRNLTLHLLDL